MSFQEIGNNILNFYIISVDVSCNFSRKIPKLEANFWKKYDVILKILPGICCVTFEKKFLEKRENTAENFYKISENFFLKNTIFRDFPINFEITCGKYYIIFFFNF